MLWMEVLKGWEEERGKETGIRKNKIRQRREGRYKSKKHHALQLTCVMCTSCLVN